jgi:hypothetical protein
MENLREYVVTVTDKCHLDSLYSDLETPGGCEYIPERQVECCRRRPILRSTIYLLTNEEAEQLKFDERVFDVEDREFLNCAIDELYFEQSSNNFDKGAANSADDVNWGLLRCVEGQNRYAWGADGIATQSGIVTTTSTGKHVDVVIVDDIVDPNHPEFAVNPDGTGGSRVIQYNWYQHNPEVTGESQGTYNYTVDPSQSHGSHVAGTVAGNTQGWARDANIYNIHFSRRTDYDSAELFGYILAWHNSKPINPETGHKNPTVINNSWGSFYQYHRVSSTDEDKREYVMWRGTRYDGPFTDDELESFGIMNYTSFGGELGNGMVIIPARNTYTTTAMNDLIDAGCLMACASGNGRMLIRRPGDVNDIEFNNSYYGYAYIPIAGEFRYKVGSGQYQYGDSISNGCSNALTVGATNSAVVDAKRSFSDCGPSVEVYAPGTNIQSAYLNNLAVVDPRNSNYYLRKLNGTSMAAPQVTGVLACLCETYPRLSAKGGFSAFNKNDSGSYYTPKYQSLVYEDGEFVPGPGWLFSGPFSSDLHDWILENWSRDQLLDTGGGYTDENSLQGGPNIYLTYIQAREFKGVNTPKTKYWNRPLKGNVWPRRSLTVYGRD